MKPIEINYRPVSFIPLYRKVKRNIPESWAEVTPKQLIAIACGYKNRITETRYLAALLSVSPGIIRRADNFIRYMLHEQFAFLANIKPHHEFIITEIKPLKHSPAFVAPKPKLKGVTFGQFIFVDTYFSNFLETRKADDRNKFLAALYLRSGEVFNESILETRHASFARLDQSVAEAIVINYQMVREWLGLAYPLIFQKKQQLDETQNQHPEAHNSESVTRDPNAWIKVFQNFVGDDILHDDIWASKPINTIFAYMTRKNKENARKS